MVNPASPIEISTPSKRYMPVRRCIYCRRRRVKLTKEHIIPFGIAANSLVLPDASCKRCAEKTRDFETVCLRHMWWPFRTRIGAPTRGKEKPDSFLLKQMKVTKLNEDGSIEYDRITEASVPVGEYPFIYYAYDFPPPGILISRPRTADLTFDCWAVHDRDEFKKAFPNDKEGFRIGPSSTEYFCKLLAKIAHAYAVAELGIDAFDSHLNGYIRGFHLDGEPNWIGGDNAPNHHVQSRRLHEIGWEIETVGASNYVVVCIRLFCFLGSPSYRVVVGKLKGSLDQLPFLKQPLYTIDVKIPFPTANLTPFTQTLRGSRGEPLHFFKEDAT